MLYAGSSCLEEYHSLLSVMQSQYCNIVYVQSGTRDKCHLPSCSCNSLKTALSVSFDLYCRLLTGQQVLNTRSRPVFFNNGLIGQCTFPMFFCGLTYMYMCHHLFFPFVHTRLKALLYTNKILTCTHWIFHGIPSESVA